LYSLMYVIICDLENFDFVVFVLQHFDVHELDEIGELVDVEQLKTAVVLNIWLFFLNYLGLRGLYRRYRTGPCLVGAGRLSSTVCLVNRAYLG
jgi:hypothetical protein